MMIYNNKMLCCLKKNKKQTIQAAFKAAFFYILLLINTGCSEEINSPPPQEIINISTYSPNDSTQETLTPEEKTKLSTSLILSSNFQSEKTVPKSSFDCDQKIFAVLLLQNYPEKTHNIFIKWIDPYEQERESTEIPTYTSKADVYTWSSLSLHRDVTAGMLQWINPAAGMEEFIGEWKVKVMIDDKLIVTEKFTVVC